MAFFKKNALQLALGVIVLLLGSILSVVWARMDKLEDRVQVAENTRPLSEYILNTVSQQNDTQTTAWEIKIQNVHDRLTRMEGRLTTSIQKSQDDIKALIREQ